MRLQSLTLGISIVCSEHSPEVERPVRPQNDPVLELAHEVKVALDRMPSQPADQPTRNTNQLLLKSTATQMLRQSRYGGSRDGSVTASLCGDASGEENEFVRSWLHRLHEAQEDEPTFSKQRTPSSNSSRALASDDESFDIGRQGPVSGTTSNRTPSDGKFDIKAVIAKNLITEGENKYSQNNFAQAKNCFFSALDMSSQLEPSSLVGFDLTKVHFTLGAIFLRQHEHDNAEEHFRKVIAEGSANDLDLISASHIKLGELCLSRKDQARNDLNEALRYATTAVNDIAEKHSQTHEQYYEALALMAEVYTQQGLREIAEALLRELPPEIQLKNTMVAPKSSPQLPSYSTFDVLNGAKPPTPKKGLFGIRKGPVLDRALIKEVKALDDLTAEETSGSLRRQSNISLMDPSRSSTVDQEPHSLLESWGFNGHFDVDKALIRAVKEGSDRIVNMLLQGYRIRARKKFHSTEQWLDKKADPNGPPKQTPSPLILAIQENRVTIVRSLLHYGAVPGMIDGGGSTPISVAARLGRTEILGLFPPQQIGVECNTRGVYNPLHIAAECNKVDVVRLLLQSSIDPSARDHSERTALKIAAAQGYSEIVKLLVEHKADPSLSDNCSYTPLMAAVRRGHTACTRSLIQAYHDRGLDSVALDATNYRNETALFIAAKENFSKDLGLLIAAGANLERADLNGWTPLIVACHYGWLPIVRSLLDAGANHNALTARRATPLDHALAGRHTAIVQLLQFRTPPARTGSRLVDISAADRNNIYKGYTLG